MGYTAYIGVGTNLGDRLATYRKAIAHINDLDDTKITRQSSLYESEPHGAARNWFLNGVVEIDTAFEASELLKVLQRVESDLGRKRDKDKDKKSVSRVIDLDILLFDSEILKGKRLTLPHPGIAERRFVLLPLSELVPALKHPILAQTISSLLVACPDDKKIHLYKH